MEVYRNLTCASTYDGDVMKSNLDAALRLVLAHEGGYSDNPADPGGKTNRGVTQRVYDAYRKRKGLGIQSVRGILADEVAEIYKHQYWDAVRADDLPAGLDYAVFDYAVNSGPRRAIQDLQRTLGVTPDGIIGSVTLAAIGDVFTVIDRLCERRLAFLRGLKHYKTFGRGWERRVAEVADAAVAMAQGSVAVVPTEATPKAEEAPKTAAQSSTVQASAVQIVSGAGAGVAAIGALDGVAQIVAIAFVGIIVLAAAYIMRERIKKLAEGV